MSSKVALCDGWIAVDDTGPRLRTADIVAYSLDPEGNTRIWVRATKRPFFISGNAMQALAEAVGLSPARKVVTANDKPRPDHGI